MTAIRSANRTGGALASCVLAAGLAAGCAGQGAGSGDQPRQAKAPIPAPSMTGEPACFYSRQVQDFRVLDRGNLIVYAPNDRHAYHVQISPPSVDLLSAEALAFLPPDNRICGYAGDRLVIAGSATGRRSAIMAVSRLSPEGLEALRAGNARGAAPAAQPQPGPGAEIEGAAEPAPGEKADNGAEN